MDFCIIIARFVMIFLLTVLASSGIVVGYLLFSVSDD